MATTTATMTEAAKDAPQLTIKQIYTYPIKSIRGIEIPSLTATPLGFAHDRRFMLVSTTIDPATNLMTNMHVSKFEEMCLFTTHIPSSSSSSSSSTTTDTTPTHIEVRYSKPHSFKDPSKAVDSTPLLVPLDPDTTSLETTPVRMHHSPTQSHDMGPHYNDWFSARFGHDVKLLYLGAHHRKVLGNVAPSIAAKQARGELAQYDGLNNVADDVAQPQQGAASGWLSGITSTVTRLAGSIAGPASTLATAESGSEDDGIDHGISFADVAPFMVISSASWVEASRRLGEDKEIDITKFRPNIVVEGAAEAWDEDYWGELLISGQQGKGDDPVRIVLTQNCARCNSLNVDYETGKVGKGPEGGVLKLLSKDRRVDPGSKWSPIFGRYGFLGGREEVSVSVGDVVRVSRRNEERTRWEWPGLGTYPKER